MANRKRQRAAAPRPTVVFDIGGVLTAGHDPVPTVHELLGGDIEALRTKLWEHRPALDAGEMNSYEYWNEVAAAVGVEDLTESEAAELQRADARYFLQLDPEARALIHDLARNGHRLALLSNAPAAFAEELRTVEWYEVFTLAIVSGEEGVAKPDPRIYEILLDVLAHETGGVSRPGSVIYFDDLPANVEAAQKLGIDAHHWPRNGGYRHGDGPADLQLGQYADGEGHKSGAQIAREILVTRGLALD